MNVFYGIYTTTKEIKVYGENQPAVYLGLIINYIQ